jgi:hypothetical protein
VTPRRSPLEGGWAPGDRQDPITPGNCLLAGPASHSLPRRRHSGLVPKRLAGWRALRGLIPFRDPSPWAAHVGSRMSRVRPAFRGTALLVAAQVELESASNRACASAVLHQCPVTGTGTGPGPGRRRQGESDEEAGPCSYSAIQIGLRTRQQQSGPSAALGWAGLDQPKPSGIAYPPKTGNTLPRVASRSPTGHGVCDQTPKQSARRAIFVSASKLARALGFIFLRGHECHEPGPPRLWKRKSTKSE